MSGSDIRATPPCARISAGTRSSAITATAPASSAIFACSALTTSMMTPPLSISAMPRLTRPVPVSCAITVLPCTASLVRGISYFVVEGFALAVISVKSGSVSVSATQTWPGANVISLPSKAFQLVPTSAVGRLHVAV
ncbi:unannotated protein [freshwater metagenome]|uniref:Unannotated protein n=1 Tax=freshwater metagenome TaxID=449393 RepID=A0A6J7T2Z0_9ZZZZ